MEFCSGSGSDPGLSTFVCFSSSSTVTCLYFSSLASFSIVLSRLVSSLFPLLPAVVLSLISTSLHLLILRLEIESASSTFVPSVSSSLCIFSPLQFSPSALIFCVVRELPLFCSAEACVGSLPGTEVVTTDKDGVRDRSSV